MKIKILSYLLCSASLLNAAQVDYSQIKDVKWMGKGTVKHSKSENNVLSVKAQADAAEKKEMIGYAELNVSQLNDNINALRFEVKGNGIKNLATVFLSEKHCHNGLEASFWLTNTDWQEVTIPIKKFARNYRGGVPNSYSAYIKPSDIKKVGFGRSRAFHRYPLKNWDFSIRNISFIKDESQKQTPENYSQDLNHTVELIKAKKPINILLLGDSITDSGRNKTYAHHMAKKLEQEYDVKCNIYNAGIGGHTVRKGKIVLPRGLANMPKPDLVTMFYGANDCWAAERGMTAQDFQEHYEALIDTVRTETDGKADIMIFTGLHRLDKETRSKSVGVIEKIEPGIRATIKKKNTAVCDTLAIFEKLSAEDKALYYNDTIHPKQAGHEFMGELMYESVVQYIEKSN